MTVNEFVTKFPHGTTFFIHMIFADEDKTERLWDHNFSVGWGAEYYGITRYPVGSATVRDCQIPKLMGYNNGCDVTIFAYEENYCENLKKLEEQGLLRWQKQQREWEEENEKSECESECKN